MIEDIDEGVSSNMSESRLIMEVDSWIVGGVVTTAMIGVYWCSGGRSKGNKVQQRSLRRIGSDWNRRHLIAALA